MKIVLATPLYPPEIAAPAPYVKELATRLSNAHSIVVVAYTTLPEKVPGVRIVAVDKGQPLPVRLFNYTRALWREARSADVVYVQNGASTELSAVLVSLFARTPFILGFSDTAAKNHTRSGVRHFIEQLATRHAKKIQYDFPPARPEILPFEPRPEAALRAYEQTWSDHLAQLQKLFNHV